MSEFKSFEASLDRNQINSVISKYARKSKSSLKAKAPNGHRKRNKYKDTFVVEIDEVNLKAKVYNKKNYRLSHLLENGHLILNKKGGIGWAAPQPHFRPTYDEIKSPFLNDMRKVKVNAKFK